MSAKRSPLWQYFIKDTTVGTFKKCPNKWKHNESQKASATSSGYLFKIFELFKIFSDSTGIR